MAKPPREARPVREVVVDLDVILPGWTWMSQALGEIEEFLGRVRGLGKELDDLRGYRVLRGWWDEVAREGVTDKTSVRTGLRRKRVVDLTFVKSAPQTVGKRLVA